MKRARSWLTVPCADIQRKIWRLVYDHVMAVLYARLRLLREQLYSVAFVGLPMVIRWTSRHLTQAERQRDRRPLIVHAGQWYIANLSYHLKGTD